MGFKGGAIIQWNILTKIKDNSLRDNKVYQKISNWSFFASSQ